MVDRRDWKCFIGIHQLIQIGEPREVAIYNSGKLNPYKKRLTYILQCEICGKISSSKVML